MAGGKEGNQAGGLPVVLPGVEPVDLPAQQHESGTEHGEELQKVPALPVNLLPAATFVVLEEKGHPGIVQRAEEGKQNGPQLVAHIVDAAGALADHLPQHDHVAVAQKQVRQAVKNLWNGQGNAEFPVGGAVKGAPAAQNGNAHAKA